MEFTALELVLLPVGLGLLGFIEPEWAYDWRTSPVS